MNATKNGITDANECHKNDIALNSFYNWGIRLRKTTADQIPVTNYSQLVPCPLQDVVPIDIASDCIPEQNTTSQSL